MSGWGGSGFGGGADDWSFAEHPGAQPIPFPMSAATRAFLQSDGHDDDGGGGGDHYRAHHLHEDDDAKLATAAPSAAVARFSTPALSYESATGNGPQGACALLLA